jgi:hypothetical protein
MLKFLKISPILTALIAFTGCATQSRTVTTETTYDPAPASASAQTTTRTTTETHTETQEESGGILSGTVDVVGKAIALPFRAVGGLVDLIF